jgi:hypothetical protein
MHSGTSLVIGLCEKPNLPGGASFSTIASLLLSSDGLNFRRLTYCVIPLKLLFFSKSVTA